MTVIQIGRKHRPIAFALLLAICLGSPSKAMAASCMSVTVSTSPVVFGPYDPLAPNPTDSTGEIAVSCANSLETVPPLTSITIAAGHSGNYTTRLMLNASDASTTLGYNLFIDSNRMTVWGDGTGATSYRALPAGSPDHTEKFPVYGRIPGGQNAATAGTYSDGALTIVITY